MFWLNAVAPENIVSILVADATFQRLMSSLNVGLDENSDPSFVTADVSQLPIGPYATTAVLGASTHHVTALAMFESTKAHVGYHVCSAEPHPMYIARLLPNDSPLAKSSAAARLATLATFQLPRFWSNPPAPCSMPYMFATLATFHIPMFWLNAADELTHAHRRDQPLEYGLAEHRVELAG